MLNQLIPDQHEELRKNKKIGKELIQRYYTFEDKLQILIPKLTGKDFFKDNPTEASTILELKKLRDELIHLKNNVEQNRTYYTKVYQDVLDANLEKFVLVTKNLLNFYKQDIIIEKSR